MCSKIISVMTFEVNHHSLFTDTSEREWEFGLDREFTTTWGRDKGTMHVTCSYRTGKNISNFT